MELVERVRRWFRGAEPRLIDYEAYDQQGQPVQGPYAPVVDPAPSGLAGALTSFGTPSPQPENSPLAPGSSYKIQQSYDSLLSTVQELRSALDGQARRQEELFDRLSTLPHAAEALPQTSKMQADMLKMINDRLSMHAQQQKKVTEVAASLAPGAKKEMSSALESIREQIEMGNEIDRQLVESFNRFSMMIDRLQLANQHAVDALQQVRDSYASSAMQMHEWIEKSRQRNNWLIGGAFFMSAGALLAVLILIYNLVSAAGK